MTLVHGLLDVCVCECFKYGFQHQAGLCNRCLLKPVFVCVCVSVCMRMSANVCVYLQMSVL